VKRLVLPLAVARRPVDEGTPLNFLAFPASVPLAVLIHGAAAWATMAWRARRRT